MLRQRRRRRRRQLARLTAWLLFLGILAGGGAYLMGRLRPAEATADIGSGSTELPIAQPPADAEEEPAGMTAAEAAALLADPRMVLVNHSTPMPADYTFETKACGSATAINGTLQTEAADAFLAMQAAAAGEGVTLWMQSGYRSVEYQTTLYDNKTEQFRAKGYGEEEARALAAGVVNPPGYSEHNCGLAADLNCPEHTGLDEGFEQTEAFAWLCANAEGYGFILRYPKGEAAQAVTEITYEPWHWRYVGAENAARINASGLVFEQYIAQLQQIAAAG